MTKKDYELIAKPFYQTVKLFGAHYETGKPLEDNERFLAVQSTVITLAELLQEQDSKFDKYKFFKACGLYGVDMTSPLIHQN